MYFKSGLPLRLLLFWILNPCITRLRVTVKDINEVDIVKLQQLGAHDVLAITYKLFWVLNPIILKQKLMVC
jgi:phosphotransferase system IIB component